MTVKHILLLSCQFLVLLKLVQTYVLFAANLDDFRSMAKKFIPDHLADQITDMASQQMTYRQKSKSTRDVSEDHLDEYIDKIKSEIVKVIEPSDKHDTYKKKHTVQDDFQGSDFEELVDRVRQKIQEDSRNKHDDKRDRNKHYDDYTRDTENLKDSYNSRNKHDDKRDRNKHSDDYIHDTENLKDSYNSRNKHDDKRDRNKHNDDYINETENLKDSYKEYEYEDEKTEKSRTTRTTRSEREFYEESNHEYDHNEKPQQPPATTEAITQEQYYDDAPEPLPQNDNMFFHEAYLASNNDSYEDYVTPKRDAVFESDSEKTTSRSVLTREKLKFKEQRSKIQPETKRPVTPHDQYSKPRHNQYKVKIDVDNDKEARQNKAVNEENEEQAVMPLAEDDDYYTEQKQEEVKAKTESLGSEPIQKGGTPKKLKGTGIPTRQHFKMSSPNYLSKIPVVAEKYNFDEPLPEKDREPENLKHLPNPPATINKKVKLF